MTVFLPVSLSPNLAKFVTRHKVLPQIGILSPHGLLPCQIACPLCDQDKLTIYQDTTNGCEWGFCWGCSWAGDLIELAAAVWKRSVIETIRRLEFLRTFDVPPTESQREGYFRDHIEQRQRVAAFWEKARVALLTCGNEARELRQQFNLVVDCGAELWKKRGGAFLGSATHEEVKQLLHPNSSDGLNILWDQLRWQEVLIIALHDMPGRLSGFLFAVPGQKLVYRSLTGRRDLRNTGLRAISGVTALDGITGSAPGLENSLFVIFDASTAVKLHVRHFVSKSNTLPVVGLLPKSEPLLQLRTFCAGRTLIYWAHEPSVELFRHAIATDGRIAINTGTDKNSLLVERAPEKWLLLAQTGARPWQSALEEHLLKLTAVEMEIFLGALRLPQYQLSAFAADCTESLKTRIKAGGHSQSTYKRTIVFKQAVIETDRGWIQERTGEVICDAIVRVDQIIHRACKVPNGNDTYVGRIIRDGEELAFSISKTKFESAGLRAFDALLIEANRRPLVFCASWQRFLRQIVFSFCTPVSVPGLTRYGWEEASTSFVFPNFVIKAEGVVEEHRWPHITRVRDIASNLRQPEDLDLADKEYLREPEAATMLAVAAAICYHLLAPVYRQPALGFGIVGESTMAMQNFAVAMGCPELNIKPRTGLSFNELKTYGWPLVMRNTPAGQAAFFTWLELPRLALVEMSWMVSRVCQANGKWLLLEGNDSRIPTIDELATASKVIPSFLQHRMKRQLHRPPSNKTPLDYVLAEMDEWLCAQRLPVGTADCARVRALISNDTIEASAWSFLELLCGGYNDAKIFGAGDKTAMRKHCKVKQLQQFKDYGGSIWIPKNNLYSTLGGNIPMIDTSFVSRAMGQAGILLAEKDYAQTPGWLISKKVWDEQLNLWRARNRKTFRIAR